MLVDTRDSVLNESQQSFDAGSVFEDEGICFKTSYCCTKRSCCNCIVIGEIVMDLIYTLSILMAYTYAVVEFNKDDRYIYYEVTVNFLMTSAPIYLIVPVKLFYGIKWLRAGCTRQ